MQASGSRWRGVNRMGRAIAMFTTSFVALQVLLAEGQEDRKAMLIVINSLSLDGCHKASASASCHRLRRVPSFRPDRLHPGRRGHASHTEPGGLPALTLSQLDGTDLLCGPWSPIVPIVKSRPLRHQFARAFARMVQVPPHGSQRGIPMIILVTPTATGT